MRKLRTDLNTKKIALIVVFAALAIALSPVRIPTFFWPGQYFRLWEIPVIVAFFLFGFKIAFSVTVLYAAGFVSIIPDASGIIGFPWAIVLMLSVFLGLFLAGKLISQNTLEKDSGRKKPVIFFTLCATLSRTVIMPFVDYGVYRFLLPLVIGHPIPDAYILGLMPAIVFFNAVTPLYIIPVSYLVTKTVSKHLRIETTL